MECVRQAGPQHSAGPQRQLKSHVTLCSLEPDGRRGRLRPLLKRRAIRSQHEQTVRDHGQNQRHLVPRFDPP